MLSFDGKGANGGLEVTGGGGEMLVVMEHVLSSHFTA